VADRTRWEIENTIGYRQRMVGDCAQRQRRKARADTDEGEKIRDLTQRWQFAGYEGIRFAKTVAPHASEPAAEINENRMTLDDCGINCKPRKFP